MQLYIASDGTLSLQDADNMREFSIHEETHASAAAALAGIAEAAPDDHFWIDAEAVIGLSPRGGDAAWIEQFWDMLKKVEAYGYSDLSRKRVKAHVEAPGK